MLSLKSGRLLPGLLTLAMVAPVAFAGDIPPSQVIQMAELIVGPDKAPARPSSAHTQRERAGGYQNSAPVNSENDEIGILAPRGGAPSEERAYDNRTKARAYQQGGEAALVPLPMPALVGSDTAQTRGNENRNKARAYAGTGNAQDMDLSHVGRDGIPLVPCRDVDNVSGRIGDDSISGSLVFIERNGQQVKVRCR